MNSQETLMETFTEDQQMQVFNLMSIGNIDDVNFAAQILAEFNFDLDKAAQKMIEIQTGINETKNEKRMSVEGNDIRAALTGQAPKKFEDLKSLYRKRFEKKLAEEEGNWVSEPVRRGVTNVVSGVKNAIKNIVPTLIRGESAGGEHFGAYFRKNFEKLSKRIKFNKGTFEENIEKAHDCKRPLLVYVHVDSPENKEITNAILGDPNLMDLMNIEFYLLGLSADDETIESVSRFLDISTDSQLALFRRNLFDEVQLMESYKLTVDTDPADLVQKLKNVHGSFYMLMSEEEKIKSEVQQSVLNQRRYMEEETFNNNPYFEDQLNYQEAEQHYGVQPHLHQPYDFAAEQQKLEDDRLLRQIQEEEYKEVERKIKEKQLKEAQEESIRVQKEEEEIQLRAIQEEQRKKRDEEKQKKIQTLPQEPSESDPDVITIAFRLPDGNRIERRFKNTDKAKFLYLFVDTQDIPFDKGTQRYDLIQPRPFLCLDDWERPIGEYFEGSSQEVVQIREHND